MGEYVGVALVFSPTSRPCKLKEGLQRILQRSPGFLFLEFPCSHVNCSCPTKILRYNRALWETMEVSRALKVLALAILDWQQLA